MKYRDHKGGLQESMETLQEFDNEDALVEYLEEKWKLTVMVIDYHAVCPDPRIGWDMTYYVMVNFKGIPAYTVVGMSDSKF